MKPILYKADETDFNHKGIGVLFETIACEVTEERNGEFELYLEYPASGLHYAEMQELCLVKAKPNSVDDLHLFRIYERQLDTVTQMLSVYAKSISNDLGGNLVQSVASDDITPQAALDTMKNNLIEPTNFMFHSDINTTNNIDWKMRNPLNCIAGEEGSLLDVFGGEIKRGNDFIWLYARRGRDNVATIRHGKNLTGLDAEYSTKGLVTQILPYFTHTPEGSETEETIVGNLVISQYANNYPVTLILPVDYSNDDRVTDIASLNSVAANYFVENTGIDKPGVTMDVELDDLSDSSEFEQFKALENIELCDTVTIYSKQFDVNIIAKVTKIVFDALREKNQSLKVGSIRTSFYDDLKGGYKDLVKDVTATLTNTIEKAANGKNRVFRGTDEPLTGMVKNDVWYKPVGAGEIEMYVFDGAYWQKEAYSADSLGGTVNFSNINAINLNLDALTTASISGANFWLNLLTSVMRFIDPATQATLDLDQAKIVFNAGTTYERIITWTGEGAMISPGPNNTGTNNNTSWILEGPDGSHKYIHGRNTDYNDQEHNQRITMINDVIRFHSISGVEFRDNFYYDGRDKFVESRAGAYYLGGSGLLGMWEDEALWTIINGYSGVGLKVNGTTVFGAYAGGLEANADLYMNGHTIWNESDEELKLNILPTDIDAIAETKRQNIVEFEWDLTNPHNVDKPQGRQLGLIAQDAGVLQIPVEQTGKGYLGVDVMKQINLNTLANQTLISDLETTKKELADLKTLLKSRGVIA